MVCPQPGQGQKHHPEARIGLFRLILTKIHTHEWFGPPHGGPEGLEGPKIGFFLLRGHPDRKKKFNLSPRGLGPPPLNVGQVWYLDLCVTLGV